MQPGARLLAVMELAAAVDNGTAPMDRIVRGYFRVRRYAGSGDRRAITEQLYSLFRNRVLLRWQLSGAGVAVSPRTEVLAACVSPDLRTVSAADAIQQLQSMCQGGDRTPAPLEPDELSAFRQLAETVSPPPSADIRTNCPPWLWPHFDGLFGEDTEMELAALNRRAPLDLRANTLRTTADAVLSQLRDEGLDPEPGALAADCIRLPAGTPFQKHPLLQTGLAEMQDQGAQVAVLASAAAPGMQVADLCAGAGGKSLALAAVMQNSGQIYAFDISGSKLKELQRRAKAAGVRNLQVVPALPDYAPDSGSPEERRVILDGFRGQMDIVLVDAPCSGVGTWRRHPELRWRVTPENLAAVQKRQQQLLLDAFNLLKPGGRIIYVTCSLLALENDAQITALCDAASGLTVEPALFWARNLSNAMEDLCRISPAGGLLLTPAKAETDGFYVARLQYSPENVKTAAN